MTESSDPFGFWENQLNEHSGRITLPTEPEDDEDPIAFAQRLQLTIANAPLDDRDLLAEKAINTLRGLYGFEFYGRQLSLHAMRAYIFDPRQPNDSTPIGELPAEFRATGFSAPFKFKKLPKESIIGLGLDSPNISSGSEFPAAYFGIGLPLTIPVLGIEEHEIN